MNKARYSFAKDNKDIILILQKRRIRLYDILMVEDRIYFSVNSRDEKKIDRIIINKKFIIRKEKDASIVNIFKNIFYKSGFIIGIIMLFAVVLFMGNYIYEIEISGCSSSIQEYELKQNLFSKGVKEGIKKGALDYSSISRELIKSISGLSFLSLYEIDGKLRVQTIYKDEPNMMSDSSYIIATDDGVVTRVLVESGTALVKEGDRVLKGDVLIDGYIDKNNPEDPDNERIFTIAKGEVYARVWISERLVIPKKFIESNRTGRKIVKRVILSNSSKKYLLPKCSFTNFECEISEENIVNILPLTIITYTFFEIEYIEKKITKEDIAYKVFEANNRLNQKTNGDTIINTWNEQNSNEEFIYVEIVYEIERKVS